MKIKNTINFKTLREKGPSAIDLEGEEVVQLVSSKKEMLCIVRQEYLLHLESAYNTLLIRQGLKQEELVDLSSPELLNSFSSELAKISGLARDDQKEFSSKTRLPKFFGSPLIKSQLEPTSELEILKKKMSLLETNHPELFKEKQK